MLYDHETLPLGEFAIGTNTTAYVFANKHDIVYKLPILIVEKMEAHFAVGDTCYSRAEDVYVTNPDGKEIISRIMRFHFFVRRSRTRLIITVIPILPFRMMRLVILLLWQRMEQEQT